MVVETILGKLTLRLHFFFFKFCYLQKTALLCWTVSLAGLVSCLYAGFNLSTTNTTDRLSNGFYLGFNRPAWSIALCGLIILCVGGYGGPINAFLSHPIFQFLTKISYSMYLVHYAVINVRYSSMKETFRFSNIQMVNWLTWKSIMFKAFLYRCTFFGQISWRQYFFP